MSDAYIQPTPEELAIVQKFIDFSTKRYDNLILMNEQIPNHPIDQEVNRIRQEMIEIMKYGRGKTIELFEDYKTGRVPVPFAVGIIQK